MVTGITYRQAALGLCLFDKLIVGVLKQIFEINHVLKIFQMIHLFFLSDFI
jgi:hypothetical protein